jgi:hypothetical protein
MIGVQDLEEEVSLYSRNDPRLIRQYTLPIRHSRNPRFNMAILDMSMVPRPDFVGSSSLLRDYTDEIDPRMRITQSIGCCSVPIPLARGLINL